MFEVDGEPHGLASFATDLAHDGRTVAVVTHSVANLGTCDRVLVLVPGSMPWMSRQPAPHRRRS